MLSIKNNLMAANAARHLGTSYTSLATSVERLSSGQRINSAKDDAAGLAVRELIRGDVAQLNQAARNAQDAVSMLQTAEGAMAVIDDLLVRMKELAEQAATGSYSGAQRTIMDNEYTQLAAEVTRIAESTSFNGTSLLDGNTASVDFHIGSASITFTTDDMRASQIANDASLNSSSATSDIMTNNVYVATASDTYITGAEITNDTTDKISFAFGARGNINLDYGTGGANGDKTTTGVSLNQLVQDINTAAAAVNGGADYATPVASAKYDSTYNAYRLQLEGSVGGAAETFTMGTGVEIIASMDNVAADFNEATTAADAGAIDLTTTTGATGALSAVSTAITNKDTYRAKLGYYMNRLEAAGTVLNIQSENLQAAESRISDVDVATEMANMTRNQVLAQAGISMLAQANSMPQMALKLLG
jgi:flagellin